MATRDSSIGCWVMGVISVVLLGLLFIYGRPYFDLLDRSHGIEANSKQNLHSIQLALERYAVDHEGPYPLWLSGGSFVAGTAGQIDERYLADPLITESYMPKYPRNPFMRVTGSKAAEKLRKLQDALQDPLRPDDTASMLPPAYRFGADCDIMGSVLADPRFSEILAGTDAAGNPVKQRTGSDVIYPCWDVEAMPQKQYWLQGQFFYKASGPVIAVRDQATGELAIPEFQAEMYMLGGFGSVKTKGQDVLGEEPLITLDDGSSDEWLLWKYTGLEIPGMANRQASPFGMFPDAADGMSTLRFGNPNGIADQVIMVLTAGENENLFTERKTK